VNQGGPYNPNPYGNPYNAPQPGYPAPPAYGGQQPYGGGYGGGYEFNQQENAVVAQAAFWARLLGIFLIITGAVAMLNCNIIQFALDLAVGIAFLGGASSLNAVVNTQGNDVQHMMTALTKLGGAFKIRVIVTFIAVGLLAVGAVVLTLVLLSAAASSSH
jgi:hypothetical protein